jgi:uncharacterized phage protein (TIGR02220 family)
MCGYCALIHIGNMRNKINKSLERTSQAKEVLNYLNEVTGRKFGDSNLSYIIARLHENNTVEDCKKVIFNQSRDEFFIKNKQYMRPSTLFRRSKFTGYLLNNPKMPTCKECDHGKRAYCDGEVACEQWRAYVK